jgi:hypothetical protein
MRQLLLIRDPKEDVVIHSRWRATILMSNQVARIARKSRPGIDALQKTSLYVHSFYFIFSIPYKTA